MTHADLEAQASTIVARLGGKWHKGGGMCRCPIHDDREPSLSIRVGHTSLLFKCFAGCASVDIIRYINDARILRDGHIHSAPRRDTSPEPSYTWRRGRAREIWDEARPLRGTPAERYLQERGISGPCAELRYHARTPIGTDRGLCFRPAMIAAIRDNREIVAIQRTFLDVVRATKAADLDKAKMALGTPGRGAVRLAPATTTLGIAEGIETARSATILLGIPVWAVLGNERFALVDIPDTVTRLVLLPDRGRGGERGEMLGREAHRRPGRTIQTLWPPEDDWNVELLAALARR